MTVNQHDDKDAITTSVAVVFLSSSLSYMVFKFMSVKVISHYCWSPRACLFVNLALASFASTTLSDPLLS